MFKGSFPALVTPFKDGSVDHDTLKRLVDWHVEQGSDGLVPVGTTGESPTLSHSEHQAVVETVVSVAAGRIPVIAGAGSTPASFASAIAFTTAVTALARPPASNACSGRITSSVTGVPSLSLASCPIIAATGCSG